MINTSTIEGQYAFQGYDHYDCQWFHVTFTNLSNVCFLAWDNWSELGSRERGMIVFDQEIIKYLKASKIPFEKIGNTVVFARKYLKKLC